MLHENYENQLIIYPDLTKSYIFNLISEKDIFQKYLKVRLVESGQEEVFVKQNFKNESFKIVQLKEQFTNPLRVDYNNTCELYRANDNRIRFTDYAGYTSKGEKVGWDCFDLVEYIINNTGGMKIPRHIYNSEKIIKLNTSSKELIKLGNKSFSLKKLSFKLILEHIAKTFKIHRYAEGINIQKDVELIKPDYHNYIEVIKVLKRPPYKIEVTYRNWNKYDYKYWIKYNINIYNGNDRALLRYFKIYPVLYASLDNKIIYDYRTTDLCYAYIFDKIKGYDYNEVKLYYPFRTYGRFTQNCTALQGLLQYNPAPVGIITKAYKDVVVMRKFKAFGLPLQAVAPMSESVLLKPEQIDKLKSITPYLITLFDLDFTGVRLALSYYKKYAITPFFFTGGKIPFQKLTSLYKQFGKEIVNEVLKRKVPLKFKGKDFSDNVHYYGSKQMQVLINKMENKIIQLFNL